MGRVKDNFVTDVFIECPECGGDGWIEYDVPQPRGHGEGFIDTETEVCDHCYGDGRIEIDSDDLDGIDF